eukprot:1162147-Pelagomonas_calceolata.AAC.21
MLLAKRLVCQCPASYPSRLAELSSQRRFVLWQGGVGFCEGASLLLSVVNDTEGANPVINLSPEGTAAATGRQSIDPFVNVFHPPLSTCFILPCQHVSFPLVNMFHPPLSTCFILPCQRVSFPLVNIRGGGAHTAAPDRCVGCDGGADCVGASPYADAHGPKVSTRGPGKEAKDSAFVFWVYVNRR